MPHETPLIATIVVGLALAFLCGAIAHRLRVSPIVGYLLAGIIISPNTPGFVGNQAIANELAEIGVILLMFGVGLHFSLKELWSVRVIAIPGAVAQIAMATLLGLGLAHMLGWTSGVGIVFGLALSTASTVVLLRALQERRLVNTERGHIAVGWLVVEDIVMVLTLVLLPALAPFLGGNTSGLEAQNGGVPVAMSNPSEIAVALLITLAKIGAFFAIMIIVGRRVIPWILHYIAHTGSRELFRLAVFSIALGVAFGAAKLFGVSFALGAFFAGMILSESELSQQAANESLPLRDAFAVLFFVSVGMLFSPEILVEHTWAVVATVLIIMLGKSLAALAIMLAFRYPLGTALTISASLAQIGEFSFILAALGVSLDLLPETGRDLILAGALITILVNPLFFTMLERLKPWLDKRDARAAPPAQSAEDIAEEPLPITTLENHVILVGLGRVGRRVAEALLGAGRPLYVIDETEEMIDRMRRRSIEGLAGNAVTLMQTANLPKAAALIISLPNAFEAGQIVEQARSANPDLFILARGQSEAEADHLRHYGASEVIVGDQSIANDLLASYRTQMPS